jgi:arylsulfatase A-like enzyme/cyclophilin family peptidyl-prolyl cis-trans isomerase
MKLIRLLVGCWVAGLLAGAGWAADAPPNILFILTDDLGINDLACYGRRDHHTPHLDRLAAQGTRFTSAYCAQPICSPSRAAILSGKTPARLHLTTYLPGRPDCVSQKLLHPQIRMELPLEERTLAEHLKEAGYATACIGKWHVGGQGFGPREQGFDFYHAGQANTTPSETEGGKGEYDLTAAAEKFIEENQARPFFVHLCHNTPHIPYNARTNLVQANKDALEPVYAAVIEAMDDTVGRLMARLDALGLATNTVVIFTSDNGGLHVPEGPHRRVTHNTPFRAGKGFVYEGGLRIPLIVRWPGHVPAGRVVDAPVINTDWLPTLVELAGRPVPAGLDGTSGAGLLTGREAPAARSLFWHFPHYNNQGGRPAGAVRDGDWKLIESYDDGRVELYNLAQDVGETNDLAAREPQVATRLQAALSAWRAAVGAQTNVSNPDCDLARHRALYVDVDVSRYNAATATPAEHERVLAWRRGMNDALPKASASAIVPPVGPVPEALRTRLGLAPFYQKYLEVAGLPILGSSNVTDFAMREAAWIVRRVVGDRDDILQAMASNHVRLVVMAYSEYTTDVPEHSGIGSKVYWDRRARGLGATRENPVVSCAEENLLCYPNDPYSTENILIHEFAHAIHGTAGATLGADFDQRLRAAYRRAQEAGRFKGTYAGSNAGEYWAEAVQDWFDDNRENDALHNHVNTRAELKEYDPDLAALVASVLGDRPWRYKKPMLRPVSGRAHLAGFDPAAAPRFRWREAPVGSKPRVSIQTALGDIVVELDAEHAPVTTKNFLRYVQEGFYSDGRFHRTVTGDNQPTNAIKIAVVQASAKPERAKDFFPPIALERTRDTGLRHLDGTISMARDGPDTAQDEFFLCVGDQPDLDCGGRRNPDGQGFAAFGRVVRGMDVVRTIHQRAADGQTLTPPVLIQRAIRVE